MINTHKAIHTYIVYMIIEKQNISKSWYTPFSSFAFPCPYTFYFKPYFLHYCLAFVSYNIDPTCIFCIGIIIFIYDGSWKHIWYLPILLHHRIIWTCKKYTKSTKVHKIGQNRQSWPKFRVFFAKKYIGLKKYTTGGAN